MDELLLPTPPPQMLLLLLLLPLPLRRTEIATGKPAKAETGQVGGEGGGVGLSAGGRRR